jgi:membrane-bound lytic murein transglycosylase D
MVFLTAGSRAPRSTGGAAAAAPESIARQRAEWGRRKPMHRQIWIWTAVFGLLFGCSNFNLVRSPSGPSSAEGSNPAPQSPARPNGRPALLIPSEPASRTAATEENAAGGCEAAEPESEEEESVADKELALAKALKLCQLSQDYWQRGELENAVETLDEAYALILDVDPENDAELLQQKEDLRLSISKRILEIYSSRKVVVNGTHNAIPLTLNQYVQNEINAFTTGSEKDFFLQAYRRSGRYRPMIEAALKDAGLPEELSWLPLIESGFRVTALSPARALGLWQFIPSTGYRYGLSRDTFIDERLDPEKATRGAIDYLKELHGMFGDWTTVLAAYNCGEHRVIRTIQDQNINYLDNFWDLYERLPRETARYVPRFLATLQIISNPEKYGLQDIALEPPLEYETVRVPKQTHLKSISRATGLDEALLREMNSELRQAVLPEEGYELHVPIGDAGLVLAKMEDMPQYRPAPTNRAASHTVRRGETLSGIARRYRTDVKSIMLANNMRQPRSLRVGQKLRIPTATCPAEPRGAAVAAGGQTPAGAVLTHEVKRGDSLWNIANRYGTTVDDIRRLNGLRSSTLVIGQELKVAARSGAAAPQPAAAEKTVRYKVRPGDNPFIIAKRYHMPLERLLSLNNLDPDDPIHPGQLLIVED